MALIELFDKIENFFVRLHTYTEVPPTAEMTSVMVKIMAEVLYILAIATKKLKERRPSELIPSAGFLSLNSSRNVFSEVSWTERNRGRITEAR